MPSSPWYDELKFFITLGTFQPIASDSCCPSSPKIPILSVWPLGIIPIIPLFHRSWTLCSHLQQDIKILLRWFYHFYISLFSLMSLLIMGHIFLLFHLMIYDWILDIVNVTRLVPRFCFLFLKSAILSLPVDHQILLRLLIKLGKNGFLSSPGNYSASSSLVIHYFPRCSFLAWPVGIHCNVDRLVIIQGIEEIPMQMSMTFSGYFLFSILCHKL